MVTTSASNHSSSETLLKASGFEFSSSRFSLGGRSMLPDLRVTEMRPFSSISSTRHRTSLFFLTGKAHVMGNPSCISPASKTASLSAPMSTQACDSPRRPTTMPSSSSPARKSAAFNNGGLTMRSAGGFVGAAEGLIFFAPAPAGLNKATGSAASCPKMGKSEGSAELESESEPDTGPASSCTLERPVALEKSGLAGSRSVKQSPTDTAAYLQMSPITNMATVAAACLALLVN
mmetsp:Transcript_40455/g.73285  ORF Transcript_40455/g.73285 Transcript_40455/m.73285 type:complete len:233 (-) Transcript_40455:77-775(-)